MSMLSAFALHCPCKRKNGTPKENSITPKENFDTPKENSITPRVMALSLVNSLRPKGTNKKAWAFSPGLSYYP